MTNNNNVSKEEAAQVVTATSALAQGQTVDFGGLASMAMGFLSQNGNSVHALANSLLGSGSTNGVDVSGGVTEDLIGALAKGVTDAFEHVPRETHQDLWPFRGALCALETEASSSFFERLFQSQAHTTGSRFMLLGSVDFTDEEFLTQFREASGSEVLADAFIERGGVPNFSQQLTVFGQTYAGLEVVDAICAAPLLEMENVGGYTPPKEDILIESVVISSYGEEDAALNELP